MAPWCAPRETSQVDAEFRGTERFRVLRRLGAGGMGVVYAVHDGVRNEAIALKTLLRARPADVSRLKREFRSLADIAHPNVVCLHELVVEPEHCFFTMELVDGVSLSEYVRAPVADAGTATVPGQRADPGLVRSVLRQIVAGVSALHGKGKLHRDIKPSNIMVRPDGRVVILDFGLMSDALPGTARRGRPHGRHARLPRARAARRRRPFRGERLVRRWRHAVRSVDRAPAVRRFLARAVAARKSHSDPLPPASHRAGGSRRSQRDLHGIAVPRSAGGACPDATRSTSWPTATPATGNRSIASRAG